MCYAAQQYHERTCNSVTAHGISDIIGLTHMNCYMIDYKLLQRVGDLFSTQTTAFCMELDAFGIGMAALRSAIPVGVPFAVRTT